MWYFSMLYIVCLYHCMYVCYMFIKYQSVSLSMSVSLCVDTGISETTCPCFTKFTIVYILSVYSCGSIHL